MPNQQKTLLETRGIVDDLRTTYVRTPRDAVFRSHFDRLLDCDDEGNLIPKPVVFTATGETRGIVLVDGAGGGKTSLVNHALSHHPALLPREPGTMPFISVRVPSPATLKSLGLEILRQSGYSEVSKRRERWDIWRLVRARLQLLGTVVLWIDEAHDLFRNNSATEIGDMLKTLKSLMQGEGAVIVILSGVETLWKIASFDDQVKRRYSKIELPAVSDAREGKALARLITGFCEKAGLEFRNEGDLLGRLVYASRARFGRCIENIIHAIEVALLNGDSDLTIQHFAEAWAMQEGCMPGANVFYSPRWSQIDLAAA